jgi:hypothetical protein
LAVVDMRAYREWMRTIGYCHLRKCHINAELYSKGDEDAPRWLQDSKRWPQDNKG